MQSLLIMVAMFKPFLIAVQFLTRIPITFKKPPTEQQIGYSLTYYPLVGLLLGMMLIGLCSLFSLWTTAWINAALVLTVWILLTGGLHLDGLADSVDAWVGGMGDRDRTLVIMKDSNCGPMGVIAIVLVILLKFVALATLFAAQQWFAVAIAIALARTSLVLLFLTTPYVRNSGLGSYLAAYHSRHGCIVAISMAILLITFFIKNGLILIVIAILTFLLCRRLMISRIGGTTGDTAGALVEVFETMVLLVAALLQA